MNKEEALADFIKGLRIALSNASAYPKEHPYFKESVEGFKVKLEAVFAFLDPVNIGFTADSIFLDNRYWDKGAIYPELAKFFHYRKIKNIQIRKGASLKDLIEFFSAAAMAPKDIFASGGISNALLKNNVSADISVQELDYSGLLRAAKSGKEGVDVWAFLLKGALAENDPQKLSEASDALVSIAGGLSLDQLVKDGELVSRVNDFISYLKEHRQEKTGEFSRAIFGIVANAKEKLDDGKIETLKRIFKSLDAKDLAKLLWDETVLNNKFDAFSLDLFSRITGEEKKDEVSAALADNLPKKDLDPAARQRINKLLASPAGSSVSQGYLNTLSLLSKNISFQDGDSFDRKSLRNNYRMVLLNMLVSENDPEALKLVLLKISEAFKEASAERDIGYCKYLLDVLNKKDAQSPVFIGLSSGLRGQISSFVEELMWEGAVPEGLEKLLGSFKSSAAGAEVYLKRIFEEGKVNSHILRAFVRFFPQEIGIFCASLKERSSDHDFLVALIESLKDVDSVSSAQILEYIYSIGNGSLQLMSLEAMQGQSRINEGLIFQAFQNNSAGLRREALIILARKDDSREKALRSLLGMRSLFGMRNKLILENMSIIGELGIRDAKGYLIKFSRLPYFWTGKLKRRAQMILEGWNVSKS